MTYLLPPIPTYMIDGLRNYLDEGYPPGGFLRAVLEGDLFKAAAKADANNLPAIPTYARWLFENAPASAYGSRARVEAWIVKKEAERSAKIAALIPDDKEER